MAFENISDKLTSVFKRLRGKGRLTAADVKEAMKEVRMALLEADVSYKVVKSFTARVTERASGADVLVTGDIDHHSGIDAVEKGIALIDAGHYGTEHIYISYMERYIKEKFPDLEVLTMDIEQPYTVI